MESLTRNKRIALNIKESTVMRMASIGINLMLVPILLQFLGEKDYGLWLTISSFLGWSALLDLGMGHGLKNRLSEARAHGRIELLRSYTSSAYAILGILSLAAVVLFITVTYFLDWRSILNADGFSSAMVKWMLAIFFIFFAMKLVLNQVINIAASSQRTSMADLVNLLINVGFLVTLLLMSNYAGEKLMLVVIAFSMIPVVILIAVSIWAFKGPYAEYRPKLRSIDWNVGKDVMSLGSSFLIIQLAGIVIFSTDNLIISYFIDPAAVPAYHISFRYFGIVITFFSILCTPIWPAYTEAYQKKDFTWIRSITKRMTRVWFAIVGVVLLMFLFAPTAYSLWVGDEVQIPWVLSVIMALYVLTLTWGTIFVTFINSTGKLRLQLIFSSLSGILNIPLSVFFIKNTELGVAGVMLATLICLSYGPVVSVIQYKKITNGTAKGIWMQ